MCRQDCSREIVGDILIRLEGDKVFYAQHGEEAIRLCREAALCRGQGLGIRD